MNCKPGQLAIVINGRNPKNIGLLVRVIEDWNSRTEFNGFLWSLYNSEFNRQNWLVEPVSSTMITYGSAVGPPVNLKSGPYPDSWLRPLPDVEDVDSVEDQKLLTEVA